MDCRDFRRMISRELDGAASVAESALLERHLALCEECWRFREALALAASIHRASPEIPAPPHLLPSVMAALDRERGGRWFSGWIRVAVPAAATALLVLGILTGAFLTEIIAPRTDDQIEMLGLAYLDEHPPGSVGGILLGSTEEVGNEQ